jgi:hypothetical protein
MQSVKFRFSIHFASFSISSIVIDLCITDSVPINGSHPIDRPPWWVPRIDCKSLKIPNRAIQQALNE